VQTPARRPLVLSTTAILRPHPHESLQRRFAMVDTASAMTPPRYIVEHQLCFVT
jgi:hypothetical protein